MQIKIEKHQRQQLINQLKTYFDKELDRELGGFEAEFLLDFLIEQLGPQFYNQGLLDAQALLQSKVDQIVESIHELEQFPSAP